MIIEMIKNDNEFQSVVQISLYYLVIQLTLSGAVAASSYQCEIIHVEWDYDPLISKCLKSIIEL